jgi:hypothetical protein
MKGKSRFTREEANEIIALIRKKLVSDSNGQKRIRDKIRNLGFYASDFGIGGGYTEIDFIRVTKISEAAGDAHNITENGSSVNSKPASISIKREESDEAYIINLCDSILGQIAIRQHRFDFLRGDAGTTLPVDAYYPTLNLVIEYRERQHTEEVKFFNKRITISGINRGEQRKLYDQRRREVLPEYNINLVEFDYAEFEHTRSKRLVRNKSTDIEIVKLKISKFIKINHKY